MSEKIPVFDHTASRVLFRERRGKVLELVGRGVFFILTPSPLEVAFAHPPTASNESTSINPSVVRRAAAGVKRSREAIESRRTMQMKSKRNPDDKDEIAKERSFSISQEAIPNWLQAAPVERSILYFPNEGKLTRVGKTR